MKIGYLSQEESSAVKEFTARLRDRFPHEIEAVKLYGSKARGTSTEDSDVDILILVKERTAVIDETTIDLVCDILNEFGVFIETVTLTTSRYQEAIEDQYPFAINVEQDAISL